MSLLTADQRAALTELVNISFGRSMAALSDLLGVFINLSVPEVRITRAGQVLDYLESVFGEDRQLTLVQQTFSGDFFGEAALTLPHQSGATLVQMLDEQSGFRPAMEPDALEMEVLLEVGNIVIGACLSQFAQMLNTQLSFDPPQVFWEDLHTNRFRDQLNTSLDEVILIHTYFDLEDRRASGYLMIFLGKECIGWLLNALDSFLDQYT